MVQVFKSRFTPNVTADEVCLNRGEKVNYELLDGTVIDATVDSERMSHPETPNLGYELIAIDGIRFFGDGKRIKFAGMVSHA